jgi:hypothetical protein
MVLVAVVDLVRVKLHGMMMNVYEDLMLETNIHSHYHTDLRKKKNFLIKFYNKKKYFFFQQKRQ